MAKKKYDVAERFQEVARRARETGNVVTPPKKVDTRGKNDVQPGGDDAYATRPGRFRGPNSGKDVNLPVEDPKKKKFPGRGFGSRPVRD